MKKSIVIKYATITLAALAITAMPLFAADKPEKAEKPDKVEKPGSAGADKSARAIPFRGKLSAKTDSSITVGTRTFEVTSDTKINKNGKPATLADGVVGEEVAGQYREEGGKLNAKMIRFGAKPDAPAGEKPGKKSDAKAGVLQPAKKSE